jgi:hypothetical protein
MQRYCSGQLSDDCEVLCFNMKVAVGGVGGLHSRPRFSPLSSLTLQGPSFHLNSRWSSHMAFFDKWYLSRHNASIDLETSPCVLCLHFCGTGAQLAQAFSQDHPRLLTSESDLQPCKPRPHHRTSKLSSSCTACEVLFGAQPSLWRESAHVINRTC